jgi:hypothetical protein
MEYFFSHSNFNHFALFVWIDVRWTWYIYFCTNDDCCMKWNIHRYRVFLDMWKIILGILFITIFEFYFLLYWFHRNDDDDRKRRSRKKVKLFLQTHVAWWESYYGNL